MQTHSLNSHVCMSVYVYTSTHHQPLHIHMHIPPPHPTPPHISMALHSTTRYYLNEWHSYIIKGLILSCLCFITLWWAVPWSALHVCLDLFRWISHCKVMSVQGRRGGEGRGGEGKGVEGRGGEEREGSCMNHSPFPFRWENGGTIH